MKWSSMLAGACAAAVFSVCSARADEGMWLFNNPPKKLLKEKHGFEPTDAWLDHLRMTNHHVGADTLQKIGTAERDLIKTGFFAKTPDQEIKATDLELNVLMSIEDVTQRVTDAVQAAGAAGAEKARRATIAAIEKESLEKTKLRSDVVTLYQGGAYHLYRFKKYTDVRLVFAPEKDIAFFGGDPDNFEFPRYDLDMCFFRVYEDGKPAKIAHYLKWSASGCKEGDLIFVSGHPGRTNRLNTIKHLEYIRDMQMPTQLDLLRRREINLKIYADRSLENARRAQDELFGVQNSRKARLGGLGGLQDPMFFQAKRDAEQAFRGAVAKDAKLQAEFGSAWDEVAGLVAEAKKFTKEYGLLERGTAFNTELFGVARTLVRMNAELALPNAERLREFGDAGLETLREQLFADSPIYKDFEIAKLADSLSYLVSEMGADDELVKTVLAGKSPAVRAAELVNGSTVEKVDVRKELSKAGSEKIAASKDPMIQLALTVDARARAVRKTVEAKLEEPMKQAYAKLAKAKFATQGDSVYPDATFTLRLAFGTVKGYQENGGETVAPMTTMAGAFAHADKHGNVEPFKLPKSWHERRSAVDLNTPFNFVSTADIIGGNSGSPVVNREGEVVGLIFDGNIQSLVLDYAFEDKQARAVSVHSAAIVESLRKIYDAAQLADELGK
jgi:hypothetical protein